MIVAVLAGGRGSRMGGAKALAPFRGKPLIAWPLAAAREAGLDAVVIAKADTELPDVPVVIEPAEPTHPLLGVITALERGPAVVVACDQPYVTPELLRILADHDGPALAVQNEPFPGRYDPAQLPVLREALVAEASLRATLRRLNPPALGAAPELVASVNTAEELAAAERAAGASGAAGLASPSAGAPPAAGGRA